MKRDMIVSECPFISCWLKQKTGRPNSIVELSSVRQTEFLVLLLAEMAALGQASLTTGWTAKDHVATSADSGDLGVGEDGLKNIISSLFIHSEGYLFLHVALGKSIVH